MNDPHRAHRDTRSRCSSSVSSCRRNRRGILETKLRHLARLEEMKIREEQKKLADERDGIESILRAKAKLTKIGARRAVERCRGICESAARAWSSAKPRRRFRDGTPDSEPTTVVLSRLGWVRAAKATTSTRVRSATRPATNSSRRERPQSTAGGVHRFHRPRL